jgi:hypothetical protein
MEDLQILDQFIQQRTLKPQPGQPPFNTQSRHGTILAQSQARRR